MQIFVYTPPLPHPNVEFIESQAQTLKNTKDLSLSSKRSALFLHLLALLVPHPPTLYSPLAHLTSPQVIRPPPHLPIDLHAHTVALPLSVV